MMPSYDPQNIFAKILRGEIPCTKLHECEYALAFPDIRPQAPVHVLVIPKGAYVDATHFHTTASAAEIEGFYRVVGKMAQISGAANGGYRVISNAGSNSGQEVPHYHVHILGGKNLGRMVG